MACCVGAKHNDWCKDYDIVYVDGEGKEYCIFHAPAEHKYPRRYVEGEDQRPELMSGEDFNALVFARIQAVVDAGEDKERDRHQYSNWNPRCNFAGTIFFTYILFNKFNSENNKYLPPINFFNTQFRGVAYFSKAQFRGVAYFSKAQFRWLAYFQDTQFRGEAHFNETQFRGKADFQRTQFRGEAYFSETQFRGEAYFQDIQFRGLAYFQGTQFRGLANFLETCFAVAIFISAESREKISFKDSTFRAAQFDRMNFQKSAIFTGAYFLEETSFTETIFHEYSNFEGTEFYGKTSFNHALFKEWTYFRNVVFNMDTSFAGTISKETILIENSELSKLLFTETNIESFKFIECTWPELKGRKVIYDEILNLKKENNFLKLEEIYRRLKKISRDNNDEILASAWHYKEKEMLRKRLHYENKWASLRTLFLRGINNIYWIISGYGEEPLQAFAWLFFFIAAAFFIPTERLAQYDFAAINNAAKCLPIIKMNSEPFTLATLIQGFWRILVTIQAALFAFALRNKLRR